MFVTLAAGAGCFARPAGLSGCHPMCTRMAGRAGRPAVPQPAAAARPPRLALPIPAARSFDIPATYPATAPEIEIPELEGKTAKMYRGGKICLTVRGWGWQVDKALSVCSPAAGRGQGGIGAMPNRKPGAGPQPPPAHPPARPPARPPAHPPCTDTLQAAVGQELAALWRGARAVPGAGALAGGRGPVPCGIWGGQVQVLKGC